MPYHILIIGAGASGLSAGCALIEKGHTVTIVEARDRIGGRIHTFQSDFTVPVEAGAEFIHGDQPLTLALVKQAKSELSLLAGNWYQVREGKLYEGDFFGDQWDLLTEALQKLDADVSMKSFMNQHFKDDQYKGLRKSVASFVEGYDAADLDRVSVMALKEEWAGTDDAHQYHIKGGYGSLMNHLDKTFKDAGGTIILSSPVNKIQWSAGKVKVITETGKLFESNKVIITVPLGVLQKGAIDFTPSLPEHQQAFNHMGFGGVIKFLFEFKQPFWENSNKRPLKDIAFVFSDAAIPTWWSQLPNNSTLLTGWLGGPETLATTHNEEALYAKAVTSLQYIFDCSGSEIKAQIKAWHIADWVKDAYAYGAYAYATVETSQARARIMQPVNDTIYFAGEALYEGAAMGTVEAALASGQAVARKIIG